MPEWERVKLCEVVLRSRNAIELKPDTVYKQITVRIKHKGVKLRTEALGASIGTTRQYIATPNQFIISSIDARNGAMGLVPHSLDGAIVTNDFWLFDLDLKKLDSEWLDFYTSTSSFVEMCLAASEGTTNRVRLQPSLFLAIEIPLPPLAEQRRIVARVKGLLEKVAEAQRLREVSEEHANLLPIRILANLLEPHPSWVKATLDSVSISMDSGWSPQCDQRAASDEEWGVLRTTSVQWQEFRSHENKRLPTTFTPRPELSAMSGDVLVTRAGPRKRVGVVATVQYDYPMLMISDKLIRIRPDKSKILPDYLCLSLSSPLSQEYLVSRKTGLADAQVNISQKILTQTPIAYPSLSSQRAIVQTFLAYQQRQARLKSLQAQTQAELDALPSAILARAFAGAL